MAFLSVIIPSYNSEKTIERCLASIISQTYRDFEICIVDGASSDATLAKICSVRSYFKSIRIISEPDKGIYDAMNKGIHIAHGDWLYFLGSDDEVFDQNVFQDFFKDPMPKNIGVMYGDTYISGETSWAKAGQIYDGEFDIKKLLSNNICHQSIFYRKELFKKFGEYKPKYRVCADWEINLRFFVRTPFIYKKRTVAKFYGGGVSSAVSDPLMERDLELLRKQALKRFRLRQLFLGMKFA